MITSFVVDYATVVNGKDVVADIELFKCSVVFSAPVGDASTVMVGSLIVVSSMISSFSVEGPTLVVKTMVESATVTVGCNIEKLSTVDVTSAVVVSPLIIFGSTVVDPSLAVVNSTEVVSS